MKALKLVDFHCHFVIRVQKKQNQGKQQVKQETKPTGKAPAKNKPKAKPKDKPNVQVQEKIA